VIEAFDSEGYKIVEVYDTFEGMIGYDFLRQHRDPYGTKYWVVVKTLRNNPTAVEDVFWWRVLKSLPKARGARGDLL